MKRGIRNLIVIILSMTMVLTLMAIPINASNEIKVILNGKQLYFDVQPEIIEGYTMVPMRTIFETFGAKVEWNQEQNLITATTRTKRISFNVGSPYILINGKTKAIYMPSQIINGRTLVPLRAIGECFDCQIGWDGQDRVVSLINDPLYFMLYAKGGRSRAFEHSSVDAQLNAGWYNNEALTDRSRGHHKLDENDICTICTAYIKQEKLTTSGELISYLKKNYSKVKTDAGVYVLNFKSTKNTIAFYGYDYQIEVTAENDYLFANIASYSNKFTSAQKKQAKETLREHMYKMANDVMSKTTLRIKMYYDASYDLYEYVSGGYNYNAYCTCVNYDYSCERNYPDYMHAYENAKRGKFRWYPENDDEQW